MEARELVRKDPHEDSGDARRQAVNTLKSQWGRAGSSLARLSPGQRRLALALVALMIATGVWWSFHAARSATAAAMEPVLDQVVAELAAAYPERSIETRFELETPVFCDPSRVAQLFSNLLGNAINHGAPDRTIRVDATAARGVFELSVTNGGVPIPEAARKRLFQPFYRGEAHGPSQGLGLGLYIAGEIAKAHGGTIEVDSSPAETRFTFRMQLEGGGSLRPG